MPKDLLYVLLGPALTIVLWLFCTGFVIRNAAFLSHIVISRWSKGNSGFQDGINALKLIGSAFIPFHKAWASQPAYTLVRYIFHLCLFMVPILDSGHIILLKSKLGIHWPALSGETIDIMSFLVIGIGLFFLARRLVNAQLRTASSVMDFAIILLTIAPFITGYWYAKGTLDFIPFLKNSMLFLHVFFGEIMILMAIFLFVRTHLADSKCVGCASCTISCPTGTLDKKTAGNKRAFCYSHYLCICCGGCVATCPEDAVRLRHKVSLKHFISVFTKQVIREKLLIKCQGCNDYFAPDRQIINIQDKICKSGIELPQTLRYCSRCKKLFSHRQLT